MPDESSSAFVRVRRLRFAWPAPFGAARRPGDPVPGCTRRTAGGCARGGSSARRSASTPSTPRCSTLLPEPVAHPSRSAGNTTWAGAGRPCGAVDMPETIVIGNSSPLALWIVMMRTASSSVSGRIDSATRAPSAVCRVTQRRYWRRLPPVASLHARAWSMTKRNRRHTSRGRPSAKPSSIARRSRAIWSSSSEGASQCAPVVERPQVARGRPGPDRRAAPCRAGRRDSSTCPRAPT